MNDKYYGKPEMLLWFRCLYVAEAGAGTRTGADYGIAAGRELVTNSMCNRQLYNWLTCYVGCCCCSRSHNNGFKMRLTFYCGIKKLFYYFAVKYYLPEDKQ